MRMERLESEKSPNLRPERCPMIPTLKFRQYKKRGEKLFKSQMVGQCNAMFWPNIHWLETVLFSCPMDGQCMYNCLRVGQCICIRPTVQPWDSAVYNYPMVEQCMFNRPMVGQCCGQLHNGNFLTVLCSTLGGWTVYVKLLWTTFQWLGSLCSLETSELPRNLV